jgi:hypothetical protein
MSFQQFSGLLFSLVFIASSCSQPSKIGALDLEVWRQDRGGCEQKRLSLLEDLKSVQSELPGKSANEIGRLFGAPDIQQLGKRNLKLYVYYLESGPHCENIKNNSEAEKAVFRFNAVSLLTEISIQRTMPE